DDRGAHAQPAGGDRTARLDGMLPVPLQVQEIVEQVDAGGKDAEKDEGGQRVEDARPVTQTLGEQQGGQQQEVLDPLLRADGLEQIQKDVGWTVPTASCAHLPPPKNDPALSPSDTPAPKPCE